MEGCSICCLSDFGTQPGGGGGGLGPGSIIIIIIITATVECLSILLKNEQSLESPTRVKPSFHRENPIGDSPSDFAEIWNFEVFIGDMRHFYLSGEVGNWNEAIIGDWQRAKTVADVPEVQIWVFICLIADHRRNLGRIGKIETLPIFPIRLRPSQTIGDVYDFQVGKVWDGRETVESPIVWDFPDIWKLGLINDTTFWNLPSYN